MVTQAVLKDDIEKKLENTHKRIAEKDETRQIQLYNFLIREVNKRMTSENRELIAFINASLYEKLQLLQPNVSFYNETEQVQEKENIQKVQSHNSVILRFSQSTDIWAYLGEKKSLIEKSQSVFIFRSNMQNISRKKMKFIASELKKINPEVLIFIDQEWWLVNRYIDFDAEYLMNQFLNNEYVIQQLSILSESERQAIVNYITLARSYFPSMYNISVQYDSLVSDESKQWFLDIIAYIRLKTLADTWINTHGLVLDLNYNNPAIAQLQRSFSKHNEKHRALIDAYVQASNETWVSLYAKHFPWHWAWSIDSHKWILNLSNNQAYLDENMELFEYFLDNSSNMKWLMIAHIVFDPAQKVVFKWLIEKADYLLTDDLAMQWYKQICSWYTPESCNQNLWSFSSAEILSYPNLIKVDTWYVESAR